MTVKELLQRADSRELAEWMAYFQIQNKREKRKELEMKAQQGASNMKARIR